jgi:hypothetical protein
MPWLAACSKHSAESAPFVSSAKLTHTRTVEGKKGAPASFLYCLFYIFLFVVSSAACGSAKLANMVLVLWLECVMSVWWLLGLMPAAFIGVFLLRQKINRSHSRFQTKMDLAGDEDHARQQLQAYYEKQTIRDKQTNSEKRKNSRGKD